jgi:hypothetical protein
MKSNKQGIYKQKLHGFSAKSAEFGYKHFFISSSKTFIRKDILTKYLRAEKWNIISRIKLGVVADKKGPFIHQTTALYFVY